MAQFLERARVSLARRLPLTGRYLYRALLFQE